MPVRKWIVRRVDRREIVIRDDKYGRLTQPQTLYTAIDSVEAADREDATRIAQAKHPEIEIDLVRR